MTPEEVSGKVGGMYTISPYKLNLYLECPRHYWWHYINPSTKNRFPERPYFTMGDHVHNALKHFFNLPSEERSKTALLSLLEDHWQKKTGPRAGFRSPKQEAEYKERAQLMLSAFYDRENTTVKPLWASDKLISVGVGETLSFMGKIDRVDKEPDGLHIIDYKTSKEEREDEWQLPMYAVLARRHFNKPVVKLSYLFLETGSWISMPANQAREGWVIGRVQQIVDAMPHVSEKSAWVCPDGEACTHCDYLRELGLDPKGEVVELPVPALTVEPSP